MSNNLAQLLHWRVGLTFNNGQIRPATIVSVIGDSHVLVKFREAPNGGFSHGIVSIEMLTELTKAGDPQVGLEPAFHVSEERPSESCLMEAHREGAHAKQSGYDCGANDVPYPFCCNSHENQRWLDGYHEAVIHPSAPNAQTSFAAGLRVVARNNHPLVDDNSIPF
jgi:hypothetical protein